MRRFREISGNKPFKPPSHAACRTITLAVVAGTQAVSVADHVITARVGPGASALKEGAPEVQRQHSVGGAAAAGAVAGEGSSKHITLDAGERGRIEVSARSWFDGVQEKFKNGGGGGDGPSRKVASSGPAGATSEASPDGVTAWVPGR